MPRKDGVKFWQKEILRESRIQTIFIPRGRKKYMGIKNPDHLYPEVYSIDLVRLLCQKMKWKLPAMPQTKQFVHINIFYFVNYNTSMRHANWPRRTEKPTKIYWTALAELASPFVPQDQITSNQHNRRMILLLFWASCTCYSQTSLSKGGNPELLLQRYRKAASTHWA